MYFVDRQKIEETLEYLESLIALFLEQKNWTAPLEKAALERLSHMMIESVLDVGNMMIDGFIMRDPGSYDDIVDILMDEKVVSEKAGVSLKNLIQYRKMLVQSYTEIDHKELAVEFKNNIQKLSDFSDSVRVYLTNELGQVTAFKN